MMAEVDPPQDRIRNCLTRRCLIVLRFSEPWNITNLLGPHTAHCGHRDTGDRQPFQLEKMVTYQ